MRKDMHATMHRRSPDAAFTENLRHRTALRHKQRATDSPRRAPRHARHTRLSRAKDAMPSTASTTDAMQPQTSAGSAGSGAGDMLTLCGCGEVINCLLKLTPCQGRCSQQGSSSGRIRGGGGFSKCRSAMQASFIPA